MDSPAVENAQETHVIKSWVDELTLVANDFCSNMMMANDKVSLVFTLCSFVDY